ncbi:hypothetical protein ACIA8O_35460 [Kitasatospora sp. NPDC051853]|uniref:hypothetical protein n=1 Tax=Kitasatospora sp. NPDC051853 TaxID=3364058 RepID=UPI00378D62AF
MDRTTQAPTNARLREVLDRAGQVVIIEAPPGEEDEPGRPRTVVTGDDIAELAGLLAVVDGGTGDLCRCLGWPAVRVYGRDGERIADWSLHHQAGLRGLGDSDADLVDGPALTEWLAGRGLTGSREAQEWLAAEEEREERRRRRWIGAAPAGLAEVAAEVAAPPGRDDEAWSDALDEAERRFVALALELYPEAAVRIPLLLAWAGVKTRESTGGSTWYDQVVISRLLDEEPALVLAALAGDEPPSAAQLDGASELFAGLAWTRAHGRVLPEPVRSRLSAHIEADGTGTMRWRLAHGCYG